MWLILYIIQKKLTHMLLPIHKKLKAELVNMKKFYQI